jgi:ubiquinone/menaquinone biosynthesis C-methylase UbiE
MAFDFDHCDIAARYATARALRPEVLRQWLDAVAAGVRGASIDSVLDLGCGTGRFTSGLEQAFSCDVIGVDPSAKMLAQAPSQRRFSYVVGRAEALPLADEAVDLAFASMVWHHFNDKTRAGTEIHRVLRPGKFLCIRTSTIDTLDSYVYLRFFPTARAINERTLPSRTQMNAWAMGSGFQLIRHQEIQQETDPSLSQYAARIEQRGLSDLARIADVDFESGVRALWAHCERCPEVGKPVVEPMDLFVFRRD